MKIFCFVLITATTWILAVRSSQTVKPNYAEKLQSLLESQKQLDTNTSSRPLESFQFRRSHHKNLDCQQFDADLIECFAYNIFLKNSALFRDLDNESVLVKPILTKHFENRTALKGANVTFTCETQIDALPLFLFYKLNKTILNEYNKNKNSNLLVSKYAHALQERSTSGGDLNDYKSTDPKHIRLERRIHSIDSNKDNLADLETVNLHILNVVPSDAGYYLCIVANSIKSFRVTYSYLNVVSPSSSTTISPFGLDYIDLISNGKWSLKNSYLFIGFLIATVIFIAFVSLITCYCCVQMNQNTNKKFKNPDLIVNHQIKDVKQQTASNEDSKVNTIIEKTMNSMMNNFVYVPMPPTPSDSFSDEYSSKSNTSCNPSTKATNEAFETNDLEFSREKLKLGKLIDEGTFNRMYLADAYGIIPGRYKTVVSVKMLKENATKFEYDNFLKEMELMRYVGKHENIISLLGCCTTRSGPIYAIVEHAKYGNLKSYLCLHRPKDALTCSDQESDLSQTEDSNLDDDMSEAVEDEKETAFKSIIKLQKQLNTFKNNNKLYTNTSLIHSPCLSFGHKPISGFNQTNLMVDLIRFCTQVSNGMKYLHSKNVYHRELCARNILLNEFKIAKISDLGLSRDFYNFRPKTQQNIKWLAPELLIDDGYICANSDQWSFGVLMWEVFTLGSNPYASIPVENLFDYLKEGNRMIKPLYCDDEIYDLMLECWNFKSEMRPTFSNINDRLNLILDKYERKKIEQITTTNTPIKTLKLETPTRLNLLANKLNSPNCKLISSRQSESEDSQYFSGTDTSLVYADSCGAPSSSNSTCNFSTMSPVSCCYSTTGNNYSVLPSNNAAAVRAASLMAASLAQSPPSPPPLKPLSRLLNVASAAYDL